MTYSVKFIEKMTQRMLQGSSVSALSAETGVSTSTLYRWRSCSLNGGMTTQPAPKQRAKSRGALTPIEKMRMLVEFEDLTPEETGGWLRSHGLHRADLDAWREEFVEGTQSAKVRKLKQSWAKEKRRLERELNRKDKALAEAAALLVLAKKTQALWGDEDDGTTQS